ncbi:hypothetical protein [Streptomyces misionensis]|uniref:hypothetical protein n=1 Tax=Streptomyces misionensis TaxID=67331 RepID=UPI003F4B33D4
MTVGVAGFVACDDAADRAEPQPPGSGQDSSHPDITEWADYFLHARATDADALAAFAPRDGRDRSP